MGEIAALAAALSWAIGSVLFSRIARRASPEAMNLGKCFAAGSLLAATFALAGGRWEGGAEATGWLLASAVAGLTIGDTAYFGALARLGVAPAILLLSSAPAFAAIGAWAWLGQRVSATDALGIALTLGGIALVVWRRPDVRARDVSRGLALGIVSGIGQAAGSLFSKRAMDLGVPALGAAAARLLAGGLALGVLLALAGRLGGCVRELGRGRTWLLVAGASLIGSYCGIWLMQVALRETTSTGVATTLLATSPVFAVPIARLAGEAIEARALAGALISVAGVGVLTLL